MGRRVLVRGPSKVTKDSQGPDRSPALNERWRPDWCVWQPGHWVILVLGFGGPQSPALRCQGPWEGTHWG